MTNTLRARQSYSEGEKIGSESCCEGKRKKDGWENLENCDLLVFPSPCLLVYATPRHSLFLRGGCGSRLALGGDEPGNLGFLAGRIVAMDDAAGRSLVE